MAIEIIPRKAESQNSSLTDIVFYIALFLLMATVLAYFGIRYFDGKTAERYKEVQTQIAAKETPAVKEKERAIISYRDKLADYAAILDNHILASNAFSFLEKSTHPQIVFSWFSLDRGGAMLSLSGTASNFESLGQQILLLEGNESAASVVLKKVSLVKGGGVEFQLDIMLDPKIFNNWPESKSPNR